MSSKDQDTLTATHHALLFAWISREVVQRVGEERGTTVMRQAVRRYGEQRGRRMALRAEADGQPLSMSSYLAYGEWALGPEEMDLSASTSEQTGDGDRTTRVYSCPWHTAWVENDLLVYGRLYCLDIDKALVHGFSPALRIDVNRTHPYDGEYCEHVFRDVGEALPRRGTVMPWDYHAGHLYKTMGEVIVQELGETGQEALNAARMAFVERYGEQAAQAFLAYSKVDFSRLPR